ncbi:fructosamine kinase family protein [Thiobacter aerophilum]|uniref:Fructosamine kinase family protein n=1 Tax=Thiobacter aerophilum TaxID=3121275 RepID=A0ABV0EHF5_9BURK
MSLIDAIAQAVEAATGAPFAPRAARTLGGGCINRTQVLEDGRRRFFVKIHDAERLPMFEAEAAGLAELARTGAVRVPKPVTSGTAEGHAFLVLECLDLSSGSARAARLLGEALARQHRDTRPAFGWDRDNTIGATPQPNAWMTDWVDFWREQRLGHQLALAKENGLPARALEKGERVMDHLPAFFTDHRPMPSLLHGDLWGGNWGEDERGHPVIFDPAVYYGDREADLAMTELFGGFPADFYAAYRAAWALDPGYAVRKVLYNLYHVLNHFNLFGGGYGPQAERMMERLLAECGA